MPNAHSSFINTIKKVRDSTFFTAGADGVVKLWSWN